MLDILGEIVLRFTITVIVVMNILGVCKLEHWCGVVVYLLPSKIIFCSSVRILRMLYKKKYLFYEYLNFVLSIVVCYMYLICIMNVSFSDGSIFFDLYTLMYQ